MIPADPPAPHDARRRPLLSLAAVLLAFAGIFVAGVLSVSHALDLPVPCGAESGCAVVAGHPSSRIAGVPLAYLGVAAYLAMLLLLLRAPRDGRLGRGVVTLTVAGTAASAALVYVAHAVIGSSCAWCLASASIMATLFAVSLALRRGRRAHAPPPAWLTATLAVAVAVGLGLEAGRMVNAARTPPTDSSALDGVMAADLVDPRKAIGPADAPVTIVVFSDLLCPACRAVHGRLVRLQREHPERVRLAYRHLPQWDLRGHESSGAAAALAEIAAEKGRYWEFVQSVFTSTAPPDRAGYLALLARLGLDATESEARIAQTDDGAVQRVWADLALAERLGLHATPAFVLFVEGQAPVAANVLTLSALLRSPVVRAALQAPDARASTAPAGERAGSGRVERDR